MKRLTALIAEDEPPARGLLRSMLAERIDVEVVAEAGDGRSAVEAIIRLGPELVFLDVEMPELDGFGVVEVIGVELMPAVVFVTAFDHYAIRAFEVQAFDYLLKPFDRDRLDRTVDRVIARVAEPDPAALESRLVALLGQVDREGRGLATRIPVRTEHGFQFVEVDAIDWIEADGKLLRLHAGKEVHALRLPLGVLESRLNPADFLRVHRSAIVNVTRIREVQPWFQGDYVLILTDGTRVTSGRSYRQNVRRLLDFPRGT